MFYFTSNKLIKRMIIDGGKKILCTPKRNLTDPQTKYPLYVGDGELVDKKLVCNNCGKILMEYKTPAANEDSIFIDAYYCVYYKEGRPKTDRNLLEGLFSFEVREDGFLGVECSCGSDTRSITKKDAPSFGAEQEFKTDRIQS